MNKLITISSALLAATAIKAQSPNVIFILADDLGYGDISAFNPESKIHTPNIDNLTHSGISFTDAHSSSALSTPSRYSIITGRYPWRTTMKSGVLNGFSPAMITPDRRTIAQMFSENGYSTACLISYATAWIISTNNATVRNRSSSISPSPHHIRPYYRQRNIKVKQL